MRNPFLSALISVVLHSTPLCHRDAHGTQTTAVVVTLAVHTLLRKRDLPF